MADDTEPSGLGAHLKAALVGAHDALADKVDARKRATTAAVLEQFEADLAPLLAPFLEQALADPNTPDHVRALLQEAANPQHFSASLLIGFAVGSTIGPILGAATAPYVQGIANNAWFANATRPLSPDIAAATVLKGVQDQSSAETLARQSGFDPATFDLMVQAAGQAIGLEQALLLYRRGQIDDAMLLAIIQYSNLNPKFYALPKLLQYVPPSVGESITGALKHHLDPATARENIGHAGVDPANFDWLLASAGRPPGPETMLKLWKHSTAGLIATSVTEATVRQAIAQSDINNDYADYVIADAQYFPPPRSIVPMLRANGINEAQARQLLAGYGVQEPWLSAFVAEAHTTRTTALHHATVSEIVAGYTEHVIQRQAAHDRIVALNYTDADATLILDTADAKRQDKTYAAAIRRTYVRYVNHKITQQVAHQELTTLLLPAASVTALLAQWGPERDANAPALTVSNLQGAYHRAILTLDEFVVALEARGYAPLDIKILAAEAWPPTKVPPAVHALPN